MIFMRINIQKLQFAVSVYNMQLRNIGGAKCRPIGCPSPTNPTVGRATVLFVYHVPTLLPALRFSICFWWKYVVNNIIVHTHWRCHAVIEQREPASSHCRRQSIGLIHSDYAYIVIFMHAICGKFQRTCHMMTAL